MTANGEHILETRDLTKEFKGFVAVNGVNLKVRRGSIHALIGPNGAGKTTCFNLLTHFLEPTRGRILFNGREITGSTDTDRRINPAYFRVPAGRSAFAAARVECWSCRRAFCAWIGPLRAAGCVT